MQTTRTPLVSIIMPVFKSRQYVYEAIQSILNQDYNNFELIIVEDPSESVSTNIINRFKDLRIRYTLNKKRGNLSKQLNKAIDLAKGKYIARMDSDDLSKKNRLSSQVRFLLNNRSVSVVGSNLSIINQEGKNIGYRRYPETSKQIEKTMRIKCAVAHPSVMFKRKDAISLGGYGVNFKVYTEDYDLWTQMIISGKRFYNIQKPLLEYRLHKQSLKLEYLKKQLKATLLLKEKYFRFKGGWTLKAEIRYQAEKLLLLFPPRFIFDLWKATEIKKQKLF